MSNRYSPESGARGLKAQNNASGPHGAGGPPVKDPHGPKDKGGMSYNPAKAGKCLNEWSRESPECNGPRKSY
jgi:hypothetical protein